MPPSHAPTYRPALYVYVLTSIVDLCLSTSGQRYTPSDLPVIRPRPVPLDSDRRRFEQNLMKLEICTLRKRQTESDAGSKREEGEA